MTFGTTLVFLDMKLDVKWCKWPWPIQAPHIPRVRSHVRFLLLVLYQSISPSPSSCEKLCNMAGFYSEELLAPRPTPKLEVHPLSAVRDCLFNIFVVRLQTGGRSSIRNLRTHHAWWQGPTYQPWALYNQRRHHVCAAWHSSWCRTFVLKNVADCSVIIRRQLGTVQGSSLPYLYDVLCAVRKLKGCYIMA